MRACNQLKDSRKVVSCKNHDQLKGILKSIMLSVAGLIFILVFSAVATAERPKVQHPSVGRIDRLYFYSPQMQDSVTVDVWLPQIYVEDDEVRLPVLYMHDGQNLFDASTTWNHQSWEMDSVVSILASRGEIVPPVIVGVHSMSSTRVADLMPVAPFADSDILKDLNKPGLINSPLRGDEYAAFIANDLRNYIESNYRILPGMNNTSVMGSSMGGLMSAYILCEYPDVFGSAGCLSTHWVGDIDAYAAGNEAFPQAMYDYLLKKMPRDGKHRVYFDRGTMTIDAYYGKWDDKIIEMAESIGFTRPDRLDSYVDEGASHEENAWMRRVERPLRFLYSHRK